MPKVSAVSRNMDAGDYGGISGNNMPLHRLRWHTGHWSWALAFASHLRICPGLHADSHRGEGGITNKVNCLMIDAASNVIACAEALKSRLLVCIAHGLNLLADRVPALCEMHTKAKRIVAYFHSSTTEKGRLEGIQIQMGRRWQNLVTDVDTRWNGTYLVSEYACTR